MRCAGMAACRKAYPGKRSSLAGTLKLNKLIVLYDRNQITIEGDIKTAFAENVRRAVPRLRLACDGGP